jgi:Secretion system C-terminal sorting domain
MKNILFIICLFALTEAVAQIPEFSLPLWVKDSKGNKDTVYVGYDHDAKYPLWDGDFGEKDIRDEPFVKDLDVRLGTPKSAFSSELPFLSKRDYGNTSCYLPAPNTTKVLVQKWSYMYISAKNFPISISWDSTLIDPNCTHNSFFHRHVLSKLNNPQIAAERILLRKHSGNLVLTKPFMQKFIPATYDTVLPGGDTLYCLILYIFDKQKECTECPIKGAWVGTSDIEAGSHFSLAPNPAYSTIRITSSDTDPNNAIRAYEVLDITGQRMRAQNVDAAAGTSLDIDIGDLPNGIYTLKIFSDDVGIAFKKFLKL